MLDWDHDGDIDAENIGLAAMLLDDLSSEDQDRPKRKKGCLGGCLGTALFVLFFVGLLDVSLCFL